MVFLFLIAFVALGLDDFTGGFDDAVLVISSSIHVEMNLNIRRDTVLIIDSGS